MYYWIGGAVGVVAAAILFYFFPSQVICAVAGGIAVLITAIFVGRNNPSLVKKVFNI